MHVVVVDDSQEFLDSLKSYCDRLNFDSSFHYFQDAFEALKFIFKNYNQIEVVVSDYNMKSYGMSGAIIAQKCSELSVPVIICTGQQDLSLPYQIISKLEVDKLVSEIKGLIQG